jgi:hypothetical protein
VLSRRDLEVMATWGNRSMRIARFVPTVGLLVMLGFTGLTVGCGGEPTAVTKEESASFKRELREALKEAKEARKQGSGRGEGLPVAGSEDDGWLTVPHRPMIVRARPASSGPGGTESECPYSPADRPRSGGTS